MGKPSESVPSPFLGEIPEDCLTLAEDETPVEEKDAARLFAEARAKMMNEATST
jgi:hypothetical protein